MTAISQTDPRQEDRLCEWCMLEHGLPFPRRLLRGQQIPEPLPASLKVHGQKAGHGFSSVDDAPG